MFDDIRPYRDDEVNQVLHKLINEKELQESIAQFSLPFLKKYLPSVANFIVKLSLRSRLKNIHCINDIQIEVAKYLDKIIKNSTSGFTYSGLANFDHCKPCLFISNHRDIVLDAALVNYALHKNNIDTVEAAVGDNLLHKDWVADLMRINKSFIVKRSEKTKRAMLTASKQLSSYIHHSLTEKKQNIWIAQKEGRAKDGIDKTNAALISMLLLNKNKETSIADYLDELNIIPVSISYEFDPCDHDKAKELAERQATGSYQKHENEDLKSITQGILGQKGKVHVSFCQPIKGDFEDSKAIALAIDNQIIKHYKLYKSNLSAYEQLNDSSNTVSLNDALNERVQQLTQEQKHWLLTMYANPVLSKKSLEQVL
ncbi:1-acyl-sn-glycerol-3-phosphate acyltransferase [Colwellia sp. 1_MG-2023]|uniref:1-acyl-sn-glycerol-3-phosphate acyltransferase n=1 Tax=Colwellia sp. 1_MG-2023 TaxID=3062649 RepID=UPI0026E205AD|nr:1-acyl-sn-glycerol-3-phosphate acyltransferase [Colwellia sp. 1_MG-2023]MDO6445810.1 1-acyl-sn-glycerol-3-phosphate acyltransferase [Colwellia sp. 1_MG-2023]